MTVESDHKPLELVFKKNLDHAPAKLKRIMFDVLQYSPKVVCKKRKNIPIADTLSRDVDNMGENDDLEVQIVLCMSEHATKKLQMAAKLDQDLQKLIKVIHNG